MRLKIHSLTTLIYILTLGCQKEKVDTKISVPQWAKSAIWYQIFPERFRNGDSLNDPQLEDIIGAWPHDIVSPYQVSNWTGDWYALQPWENPQKGFYYHVQRRRYGGDLQGVLDRLDYLQDLGINAIYFNPLFESPSLHKYDGATYHHIDDNFGPNPEYDRQILVEEDPADPTTWRWTSADSLFLHLIEVCHKRGIKVIIDGVFNHVGLNFWAFRDVIKRQQNSPFADWFIINHWDDPATPENEFDYQGWFGVRELPEIREDENGPVAGIRDYIFQAVQRWMDPNHDGNPSDGIDGWRLDVADMVSPAFWREFRKRVKAINPEAYLVGEVWWEDWAHNKMFNARPWLEGDIFDAVMNYRWAKEVMHYFVDHKNKISATEFNRRLTDLLNDYPSEVNFVLMNLVDSHDTDRLASQIVNPDGEYDHADSPKDDPDYNVRKPTDEEIQIQKLIATFQMTYLGAPMIYYGDEAGMWGADDPDCRKPMLWPDLTYDDEISHPFHQPRPRDKNVFNWDLFHHYQKLIQIRKKYVAFQQGDYHPLLLDDEKDIFAFSRTYESQTAVVILNNSTKTRELSVPLTSFSPVNSWHELISNQGYQLNDQKLKIKIPAKTGYVFVPDLVNL